MKVIGLSDATENLKSLLDQVTENNDYVVISREDAEDTVVMSLSQFNGLMETIHLLEKPTNSDHLARSIKQYQSSRR